MLVYHFVSFPTFLPRSNTGEVVFLSSLSLSVSLLPVPLLTPPPPHSFLLPSFSLPPFSSCSSESMQIYPWSSLFFSLSLLVHLHSFLQLTSATRSFHIFVHPVSLQELSIHKLRLALCKFIRLGDPTSFPRAHDLRKMATSFAFFKSMSNRQICDLVGWSSIDVFRRHYLRQIEEIASPLVILGSVVNP